MPIMDELSKHGAHLEVLNMFRMTPLIISVADHRNGSVKYLIEKGANPLATENVRSFQILFVYNNDAEVTLF